MVRRALELTDHLEEEAQDVNGHAVNEVSLDLILTNAVILQEFLMELAALIHVRATAIDWELRLE